jgi:predicted dehydrogenase
MMNNESRRDFIKKSALTVAGISVGTAAFPNIDIKGTIIGANDKVRVGFIGVGNRGSQLLQAFMKVPDFKLAALCDIYQPYLMRKRESVDPRYLAAIENWIPRMGENFGSDVALYNDYRKMLEDKNVDAVCIATPDHWHALQAIDSVNAGKDVYLEKPVSMTLYEGRKIVEAVQHTQRVVTVGYVRRASGLFKKIPDMIKSGKLGEITMISSHYCSNMTPNGIGKMKPETPPANFDWNMWLGPRAYRNYQYNIAPYRFRWWKDYSSQIANNGSHYLDVIQWLIGENAPVAITAVGTNNFIKDDRTIPENMEITYEMASGKIIHFRVSETNNNSGLLYGSIALFGTKGSLYLDDSGYKLIPSTAGQFQSWKPEFEAEDYTPPREDATLAHVTDFIDCVKTRKTPVSSIEQSFRSSSFALLANIALEVKQRVEWDPVKERFTNSNAANKLLHYEYRKPWKL